MLPRWHVLLGIIFTILVWFIFEISLYQASLIFLASVLIDIDHYLIYVYHNKKIGLRKAFRYYDELGKKEFAWLRECKNWKSHLQVFHTIEFHLLVLILALYFPIFYYLLIGMVFHSLLDVLWMWHYDALSLRWFFFFEWLFVKKSLKVNNKYYKQ